MTQTDTIAARGSPPGKLYGTYLAEVVSVKDDRNQGRVQIRLLGFDGVTGQDGPMWARVAVPFSGNKRGAFFIPSRGDEVTVQFVGGDVRAPIVTGGLWNGAHRPPESLGGDGEQVDRWTIVGARGTRIAIVEEQAGATLSLTTPSAAQSVTLTQKQGGSIEVKIGSSTITAKPDGITVKAGTVKVEASKVEISAATVKVDAAVSTFSGIVKATTVQATAVVGTTYTTGVGNIW